MQAGPYALGLPLRAGLNAVRACLHHARAPIDHEDTAHVTVSIAISLPHTF